MQFRKDEGMNSLFSISLSVITRQVLNTFESVNSGIFHQRERSGDPEMMMMMCEL